MKTINEFINERLHLNSDSKIREIFCIYNFDDIKLELYNTEKELKEAIKSNEESYEHPSTRSISYAQFKSDKAEQYKDLYYKFMKMQFLYSSGRILKKDLKDFEQRLDSFKNKYAKIIIYK